VAAVPKRARLSAYRGPPACGVSHVVEGTQGSGRSGTPQRSNSEVRMGFGLRTFAGVEAKTATRDESPRAMVRSILMSQGEDRGLNPVL
jgi:hypothetical protein